MNTPKTTDASLDVSFIMPCLNEARTVGKCVDDALEFIKRRKLHGEVIVVDNGSTDSSAKIAIQHGAIVVREERRGYGSAIRAGIRHSRGKIRLIGDCDMTYDFLHPEALFCPLRRCEFDVMIGDRFAGGIERNAMPFSHKLGAPFLSFCGRMRFRVPVHDFHCGLRGMTKSAAEQMHFETEGMEFATEMIAEAARCSLRIGEAPVVLRCSPIRRDSKLRTIPDGFRHLMYILRYPMLHDNKND